MRVVGITGSIGTGKTTLAGVFRRMGYEVIDLDECAKRLLEGRAIGREIAQALGQPEDHLDRKRLADVVFSDEEKLAALEAILHPRVIAALEGRLEQLKGYSKDIVFVDGPLIFEKGLHKRLDLVLVVSAEDRLVEERLRARGMDEEDVRRRRRAQMPLKEKEKLADFVIYNNGTVSDLEAQAVKCLQEIRRKLDGTPE